jgi:hypothetical protein
MKEKEELSSFRRDRRKEERKTEEKKSQVETRSRKEKRIFGNIYRRWERKK